MTKVGILEEYDSSDNQLVFNISASTSSSNNGKANIQELAIQLKNEFDITVIG